MSHLLILILCLCFAVSPSSLDPLPSFLSPVSFARESVEKWQYYFQTCTTNPQVAGVMMGPALTIPLYTILTEKAYGHLAQSVFPSTPFKRKIPTPIKLVFEGDASCSVDIFDTNCVKHSTNVTYTEDTLYFDARSPNKDYFISYYMNRTGFAYRPLIRKSNINFESNNQIEYSYVRALTLSVNANQQRKQTAFNGLGPIKNLDHQDESSSNVDLLSYFTNAVFLGASADLPEFMSHEFADGKRYPMEIYMYFMREACSLPECATQLVVLVEESEKENEQIKPVIDMLGGGDLPGLKDEEIKFIEKYNFVNLPEYAKALYVPHSDKIVELWNFIFAALERLHLAHAYRIEGRSKFERRDNVEQQFVVAEQNLIEKCPYFNITDPNSSIRKFINNDKVMPVFEDIYNYILGLVGEIRKLVQSILFAADASQKDFNFTVYYQGWANKTIKYLVAINDTFLDLEHFVPNISTAKFPGTKAFRLQPPVRQLNFNGTIRAQHPSLRTSFAECHNAITTYVGYTTDVVVPRKLDVSEFAKFVSFNDDTFFEPNLTTGKLQPILITDVWKDALYVLPEYYLTAVKDFSEHDNTEKGYVLQQEARNTVPRVQLEEKFQISWLIPNHGGHYEYTGSTPFPPCHGKIRTIVFERPIQMSRSQIQALTRIPTSKNTDDDLTNTRPPFHNIEDLDRTSRTEPLVVKYNLKNHQWWGDGDEFHENSKDRAKRKQNRGFSMTKAKHGVPLCILSVLCCILTSSSYLL